LLLAFDRRRAESLLTGDRYLSVDFGNVHRVLRGLEQEKVLVPRDGLLRILDRLVNADITSHRNASIVSSTLKLLAMHKDAADLEHFERYAESSNERAARGAAAGLLALADLEGFEKLWEGLEYEDLMLVQRRYIAVRNMDAEVCNGGLSQFFFNTAGDLWRDALDGLRVMGMTERATLLTEAVAKFGATPPSENRPKRMRQLSKVSQVDRGAFDALDKRYYASKETVVTALARYVLANAEVFR
jgi:hypothetical protein